jgi:hypothetical protein
VILNTRVQLTIKKICSPMNTRVQLAKITQPHLRLLLHNLTPPLLLLSPTAASSPPAPLTILGCSMCTWTAKTAALRVDTQGSGAAHRPPRRRLCASTAKVAALHGTWTPNPRRRGCAWTPNPRRQCCTWTAGGQGGSATCGRPRRRRCAWTTKTARGRPGQ